MRQQAWNVIRNGRIIDTVFYDRGCSKEYIEAGESAYYGLNIRVQKADKRIRYFTHVKL